MKRRWAIVIVLMVLLLAGALVAFGDRIFGNKNGNHGAASGATNPGTSAEVPSVFPLKKGSRGEEVRKLQHYLNGCLQYYLVLTPLDEDGIFGAKTEGICVTVTGSREITEEFYNQYIK